MVVDFELADKYILYDLVVRTLELDISRLSNLKTGKLLVENYERVLGVAKQELLLIKEQMKKADMKIDNEVREDELITEFHFTQRGYFQKIRYTNLTLRNRTLNEIEKLMKQ